MVALFHPRAMAKKRAKSTKASEPAVAALAAPVEGLEEDECVICMETPTVRGKINSCSHLFCFECIQKWANTENTCPLCKKRFTQISKVRPEGGACNNH